MLMYKKIQVHRTRMAEINRKIRIRQMVRLLEFRNKRMVRFLEFRNRRMVRFLEFRNRRMVRFRITRTS